MCNFACRLVLPMQYNRKNSRYMMHIRRSVCAIIVMLFTGQALFGNESSMLSVANQECQVDSVHVRDTVVCAERPLVIDNQTYEPHVSGVFSRTYTRSNGCDSVAWCYVTVLDSILPDVRVRTASDEPNSGAIFIYGKGFDYYTVDDGYPQTSGSIVGLDGGIYTLEFFNELGCSVVQEVNVSACVMGWLYQRWDDVLSLKNFSTLDVDSITHVFRDFQWFKNDEPIAGATLSYLYVEGGLEPDAAYHLEMTRVSTDEKVVTCPVRPMVDEDKVFVYIYPSPVRTGEVLTIRVSAPAKATILNTFGAVVMTLTLQEGVNYVQMNVPAGLYVVQTVIDGQTFINRIGVID